MLVLRGLMELALSILAHFVYRYIYIYIFFFSPITEDIISKFNLILIILKFKIIILVYLREQVNWSRSMYFYSSKIQWQLG